MGLITVEQVADVKLRDLFEIVRFARADFTSPKHYLPQIRKVRSADQEVDGLEEGGLPTVVGPNQEIHAAEVGHFEPLEAAVSFDGE